MTAQFQSALVLFSGGQDSTVCLAWALARYDRVETIGFDYGQRHAVEMECRANVLREFPSRFPQWGAKMGEDLVADLTGFGRLAESALTADQEIAAPEGQLPSTFVPGRNLAFLTSAAARAAVRDIDDLVGGMCQTDYSGYPDCRRDTMDAMETALERGMGRPVPIRTPLMDLTKAQTWALADELGGAALTGLIVTETHTCYRGDRTPHDWGAGCGDCPACDLREKGWREWRSAA